MSAFHPTRPTDLFWLATLILPSGLIRSSLVGTIRREVPFLTATKASEFIIFVSKTDARAHFLSFFGTIWSKMALLPTNEASKLFILSPRWFLNV